MIAVFAIVWFTAIYLLGGMFYLVHCYLPYEDEMLFQLSVLMEEHWDEMIKDIGENGAKNLMRVFVFCIWPFALIQYFRMRK